MTAAGREPSRILKKSASFVLASLRGSTYRSVRLASSLAADLLDGLLSILRGIILSS
jgi:class 3 adenylate cyclase